MWSLANQDLNRRRNSSKLHQKVQHSRGQDQKKGARSIQIGLVTGLTGPSGGSVLGGHEQRKRTGLHSHSESSGKNSRNAEKKRPSFKQLLAKYEEKIATQKQEKRPDQAKDTNPSSEHREQSASYLQQGNNTFASYLFGEPVAP